MKYTPLTPEQLRRKIDFVTSHQGWTHVRDLIFTHRGLTYDLGGADLTMLDMIIERGAFVINDCIQEPVGC